MDWKRVEETLRRASAEAIATFAAAHPGHWRYQGFNTEPPCADAWEKAWAETQDEMQSVACEFEDDEACDAFGERFLVATCRVLTALEKDGAFELLRRDTGFKTLVNAHEEPLADSWTRLLRERNLRPSRR